MKNVLRSILPSPAVATCTLILPAVLAVYFGVTQYSNSFVLEQNISYFDVQGNWFGQLFIDQSWLNWFNRFMDFAFWGLLAAVVLVGAWAVGSAKVSVKNHYAQEGFKNFDENKSSWHSHFFIVMILRVILILAIIYSVLIIVGKYIPQFSVDINNILSSSATVKTIKPTVYTAIFVVLYQLCILTCVKIFRHLSAD